MYCLLIQKKSSTILNKEKVFKTSNEIDNDSKKKIEKIKTYCFIIIIFFLFYLISLINEIHIFHKLTLYPFLSNMTFIGILITGIIKKDKLYIHLKLSFIILFFIMFFIPNLYATFNSTKQYIFILNSIYSLCFYYSLGLVRGFIKHMMQNKFFSPFFFSALNAIFHIIMDLFIYGYYYFIAEEHVRNSYFQKNWSENLHKISFIQIGLYFIGIIIYLIFDILICFFNTPYHQCVCDILAYFIGSILDFSIENIIIGIINLFFSCVTAEIIILKFCGLEKYTKIEIQERSTERLSLSISGILNNSNSTDKSFISN